MKIIRSKRPADRFAQISNRLLQDERLKLRARGLAALLLSYPPGWETSPQRLATLMPDGPKAVYAAMSELEEAGYMVRWQERRDDGRLGEVVRYIFDDPRDAAELVAQLATDTPDPTPEPPVTPNRQAAPTSENGASPQVTPVAGLRHAGKPHAASDTPIKTDCRNTDLRNTEKDGGVPSSSSSPSVPREARDETTTPSDHLIHAGLRTLGDRARFREYLRTVRGARSANAVIVAAVRQGDLVDQVREWRSTLDLEFEPDADPIDCPHGIDVAQGIHRCPQCDPARRHQFPGATTDEERQSAYREAQVFFEHLSQFEWDKWFDAAMEDRPDLTGSALVIHAAYLARQDRRNQR